MLTFSSLVAGDYKYINYVQSGSATTVTGLTTGSDYVSTSDSSLCPITGYSIAALTGSITGTSIGSTSGTLTAATDQVYED